MDKEKSATLPTKDGKRRIIIMGATSGIGLRSAIILALAGWRVGVAGRNLHVLKKLKHRFPKSVEYERIDITEQDAPRQLHKLIKRLGGMDIYFHVSGVFFDNPDLMIDQEVTTLQTNVTGFARMTATAYRYFRDMGTRGQIAAITSVAGTNGIGVLASYSASKRFDQTYLTALQQLANIQGVNVAITDIRPGWIRTPLENPECNYPMNMSLSYSVPRILEAIIRRRRVAVIDYRWSLLCRLWRCLPRCVWERINPRISTPATSEEAQRNKEMEQTDV